MKLAVKLILLCTVYLSQGLLPSQSPAANCIIHWTWHNIWMLQERMWWNQKLNTSLITNGFSGSPSSGSWTVPLWKETPASSSGPGKTASISRHSYNRSILWTRDVDTTDLCLFQLLSKLVFRDSPYQLKELIIGDQTSLEASGFRKLKPTKIFAHGFTNNGYNYPHIIKMRDGTPFSSRQSFWSIRFYNFKTALMNPNSYDRIP